MSCGTRLKKFLKIINGHEDLWSLSTGRYHSPGSKPLIKLHLPIGSIWEVIEHETWNEGHRRVWKYTIYNKEFDVSTWITTPEVEWYAEFIAFNYNKIWNDLNENFL